MLKRLIFLLPMIVAIVASVYAAQQYLRWHEQPLPVDASFRDVIIVPPGEALGKLAERLEEAGVIEHDWDLKLLARIRGDAGNIRAGEYELEPGMTLADLLDRLVAGRVKLHALTIVEGWTAAQLFAQIASHPALTRTLDDYEHETVASALELEGGHPEGWFLPETYRFPRGTTDVAFLQRAHVAMRSVLDVAWANRVDDLPISSPYEALILASIIEKETSVESERRTIAGVFTRRLQRGMRLQTDPTVIYGMGSEYDGRIRSRHLRTDNPYNTYTRRGLTPTPIAMPSRASIDAAVDPEPGDVLYFVAVGDGSGRHVFSRTLEEHNQAVDAYWQRVRAARRAAEGGAGNGAHSP